MHHFFLPILSFSIIVFNSHIVAYAQDGSFYSLSEEGILQADYYRQANPDLEPEKLRSAELSGSYFLLKNLSLGLNGYYTHIENLIDPYADSDLTNPIVSGTQIEATKIETSVNQGKSSIYGGSLRVNYLVKLGPSIVVNCFGAYSYIDGETDGQELTFVAKNSVKSGVDIIHKKWSVAPIVRYRSKVYTTLTENLTDIRISSPYFVVLDIVARYNVWEKNDALLSVYVKAENITNLHYYNVNVGSLEGLALTPQDPVRVLGGVNFSF